jgi:hypothetical protein
MRVKFIKQGAGPYGIFPAGRECELSGAMLAACPRDYIEEVKPEQKKTESNADKKAKEGTEDKGLSTPAHSGGNGEKGGDEPRAARHTRTPGPKSEARKKKTVPSKTD